MLYHALKFATIVLSAWPPSCLQSRASDKTNAAYGCVGLRAALRMACGIWLQHDSALDKFSIEIKQNYVRDSAVNLFLYSLPCAAPAIAVSMETNKFNYFYVIKFY